MNLNKNNYFLQIYKDFIKNKDKEIILTYWTFNLEGNFKLLDEIDNKFTLDRFDNYNFCMVGKFIDLEVGKLNNKQFYYLIFEISQIIGIKLNIYENIKVGHKINLIISSKYADNEHYKGIEVFNLIKSSPKLYFNDNSKTTLNFYLEPFENDDQYFSDQDNLIHWIKVKNDLDLKKISKYILENNKCDKLESIIKSDSIENQVSV